MKIIDILKKRKEGVSFEFFPPKSLAGKKKLEETISNLKADNPLYISMTYGAGGKSRARTKNTVSKILEEHKELEVMPHLTCIGSDSAQIKAMLDEYKAWGIDNIMALRGDIPQSDSLSRSDFFHDFSCALDIVKFIKKYGHFGISAAVYPEGHIESQNLEADLDYTKLKIDAGVDFAVTQMFFDNCYYYDFMERARAKGIDIPILPGILPLTNLAKVEQFCQECGMNLPVRVKKAIGKFRGNPQDMRKAGLAITIGQCQDLIRNGFKQIHIFTLNNFAVTREITTAIDI